MNQEILNTIQSNPQAMQAVGEAIQEIMGDEDVSSEAIDQLTQVIENTLQNPSLYPQTRMAMIQSNLIDDDDLPEQFDELMLTVLLIALKVAQSQLQEGSAPRFARGGLNSIARMGRYGDTMLAHITPEEAQMLRARGGSGTINPMTGLPEFFSLKKAFKKVFKAVAPVLPIVLSIMAPGLGTAIGTALGATGTAASMLGSAAIGGLSSAAAGGNALKGAIGGALGAGAGGALGSAIGDATGMTLSNTAQNVIGSSLIGGAQSAASGGDFLTGAVQGGIGGYAGSTLGGAAGDIGGKLGAGLQTAGTQFGNALTMGADAKQALTQGALSGLAAAYAAPSAPEPKSPYDITPSETGGLGLKAPADLAIEGLRAPAVNTASVPEMGLSADYGLSGSMTPTFKGPETMAVDYSLTAPVAQTTSAQPDLGTGIQPSPLNAIAAQTAETTPGVKGTVGNAPTNKGFSIGNAASMLPLLSLFGAANTPEEVQQVVSQMTPEQQEYFNRPMRTWNWDTLSAAAKMQGLPVGSYIARNWDKVGGGMYDNPEDAPKQLARGGALSRLARGGGSGRDDTIDAKLSDGEYVMDAETVALLGDGSTDSGARRLDQMRAKIRQHKGKSMARGKFSANAKSPLAYLKGA